MELKLSLSLQLPTWGCLRRDCERYECSQGSSANTARLVAETVQYFITAMDAVKMKMAAVDEVSLLSSYSWLTPYSNLIHLALAALLTIHGGYAAALHQ